MAQPDEERSWVEKARAGDPEAAGWLYERYFDRIYRYTFLKLGDPSDAEDLTEQVFLKMIESVGSFQWQGSSFTAWLYRIAHNLIIDFVRQHARRPQTSLEPVGSLLHAEGGDPHEHAERRDFSLHLVECMSNLTDLQAQVIILKFGSDLSNAEVAEILEKSEGAVKALQFSALQKLNKLMGARGFGREDDRR